MKHHIYADVPVGKLKKIVPKPFHARLHDVRFPAQPYTLLVFSGSKDEVVQSSVVQRALADVTVGKPLLAVAPGFTVESQDALRKRDAEMLALSDFQWTDDSLGGPLAKSEDLA